MSSFLASCYDTRLTQTDYIARQTSIARDYALFACLVCSLPFYYLPIALPGHYSVFIDLIGLSNLIRLTTCTFSYFWSHNVVETITVTAPCVRQKLSPKWGGLSSGDNLRPELSPQVCPQYVHDYKQRP